MIREIKEESEFDKNLTRKLDAAGFAEFLADNNVDDIGMKDESKIEDHIETFDAMIDVQKEYKNICKEELHKKLGIELNDDDMNAIDVHLRERAVSDPERIFELQKKVENMKDLKKGVDSLQRSIGKFERNKKAGDEEGFAFMGYFVADLTYGSFLRHRKESKAGSIVDTRSEILSEISQITALHEAIKQRVADQMTAVLGTGDFDALNKMQTRFEGFQAIKDNGDESTDLLANLPSDFQEQLNGAIERKVSEEVMAATLGISLGNGTFSNLEKALDKYLKVNKLGSKEDEEVEEAIVDSLRETAENLPDDTEGKAKRIMIYRIVQKIQNGNYTKK